MVEFGRIPLISLNDTRTPLHPAAWASVPYGIVLVRVRVRVPLFFANALCALLKGGERGPFVIGRGGGALYIARGVDTVPVPYDERTGVLRTQHRKTPQYTAIDRKTPTGAVARFGAAYSENGAAERFFTSPEATNTGPGFNQGSGGGARGCDFEERVGAYICAYRGWPFPSRRCLCVCARE